MSIDPSDERWVKERLRSDPSAPAGVTGRDRLAALVRQRRPLIDPPALAATVDRLHDDLSGVGPLGPLLRDERITDVLVNGPGPVWVERDGRLRRTDVEIDAASIERLVDRSFGANGLSVDRARPIGDTRLPGGERISVVVPPIAVDGVQVAIRRFGDRVLDLDAFGAPPVVDRLRELVEGRANVVVFGPTGSGKTSLVAALATHVDACERVVTIEDAAELRISLPHVVRLECRPDNGEGAGRIDLRALVRAALRLRPDRLVVGEVRGPEALDMIWALATGHDGSLTTCHARSAAQALSRLETFVLLADAALPLAAVRAQVRSAVDVMVGVARRGDRRMVTSIHEVVDDPNDRSGLRRVWASETSRS